MQRIRLNYTMLLLLLLGITGIPAAKACDACGCSSGGNFVGLLPQFNKKFVGIRYKNSLFSVDPSKLQGLDAHNDQFEHKDSYTTTELWARFFPAKRVQLMAFVPYSVNSKTENGTTNTISGIGDMSAIASYVVFNTTDSLDHRFRQAFLLGGGVKLPTGKYQQRDNDKVLYPQPFQVGTGAYSLLINGIYTARIDKWGFNLNANYSVNGKAENGYHFGNNLSAAASFFYWYRGREFSLIPNVGLFSESSRPDTQYNVDQVLTTKDHSYLTLGNEFYFYRYALGFNYHLPVGVQNPTSSPVSNGRVFATFSVVF
ncbi:MAG: hypothetical protein V4616_05560 [Bacteroidota bacterium]